MAKAKSHTGFRNGNLFCFNCGQSYNMQLPQPIDMVTGIMKTFDKTHKNCQPTWKEPEPETNGSVEQQANWWLVNGERGMSSETIFSVISGRPIGQYRSHPCDPDDFRRCHLLLKAVPEWRGKLDKMRSVSEVWNKLVDNWDKLTEMLEEAMKRPDRKAPGMYDLMKSLGC